MIRMNMMSLYRLIVSRSYPSLSQSSTESNGKHHTELSSSQDVGGSVDEKTTGHQSNEDVCAEFVRSTQCKKANGMPCSSLFTSCPVKFTDTNTVLLGSMMSTTLDDSHCIKDGRHKAAKRRKASSNFVHHGHNVCTVTYAFLFGVGVNHRVLAIRKHYQEHGLEPALIKPTNDFLLEHYPLMTSLE